MSDKPALLYDAMGEVIQPHQQKSYNLDPTFFWSTGSRGEKITVGDVSKRPFQHNPWVFAAAWTLMKNISRLPIVLYNERDPEDYIVDHPVLDLLRSPNQYMTSKTTFIQAIVSALVLQSMVKNSIGTGGQCFVVALSGEGFKGSVDLRRGEIPESLFPYNDSNFKPRTKKDVQTGMEALLGWDLHVPNSSIVHKLNSSEVIRVSQFNPYNWLQGISNLQPVQIALTQDIKSDTYNDSIFDNNGVPSGVLKTEKVIGEAQVREVLKRWFAQFGGPGNAGAGPVVLGQDLDYKSIGHSIKDMEFEKIKANYIESVLAAFGINKIAVGKYESINFATIREGRKILWHDAYLPIAETIVDAFNSQWIQYIQPGLRLKFDTSHVPALQPDLEKKTGTAAVMVEKMGIPVTLAFKTLGIPLKREDVEKYPWLDERPVRIVTQQQEGGGAGEEEKTMHSPSAVRILKGGVIRVTELNGEVFWRDYVARVLDPGEHDYLRMIDRFLNGQRNSMQDKVDKWLRDITKAVDDFSLIPETFLLDLTEETKKLLKKTKKPVEEQLKRDAKKLEEELDGLIRWNVTDSTIERFVNRRTAAYKKINTVTFDKARGRIVPIIEESMAENWTPQQTAKELKSAIGESFLVRKNQAKTIARTEIGIISGDSRYFAFAEEGIERHTWVAAIDEKTRDDHIAENEMTVDVGSRFPVTGLLHPKDSAGPANQIINCRCVAVAEFDK